MNFLSTIKSAFYDFEKLNLPASIEKLLISFHSSNLTQFFSATHLSLSILLLKVFSLPFSPTPHCSLCEGLSQLSGTVSRMDTPKEILSLPSL